MATYRIPNTYQTPIASALGNLMGAFASLPSPEERALKAAQVEQAQSTAELNRQKVIDSQREAEQSAAFGRNLSGAFRKAFTPVEDARPSPDFVGPIPEVPPDIRARNAAIDLAGSLPEKQIGQLPELFLSLFANAPGTSQGVVERSQIGAGKPYSSTQTAVDNELARKMEVEDNRNKRFDLTQRYTTDRQAATQLAIADRQEKALAAAATRTPQKIIGPDGRAYWAYGQENISGQPAPFDQQSGPLATDAVKARAQLDALESFRKNGADFLALARSAPDALGAAGQLRTIVAGAAEQAKALGTSFGMENAPEIVGKAQEYLRSKGISVADPAVASKLAVYLRQMPYAAASALAGQQGRSVTDNDVKRFERLLGETPISNLAGLEARWQVINQMIDDEVARTQPRLNMRPTQPGTLAQPGLGSSVTNTFQQPAAAAPAAAPARRRYNPATGQIE